MVELNTLGTVIKSTYEDEPNTNAFTDSEKTKLAGLATVATSGAYADLTGRPAADFVPLTQRANANGVATLDASGKVPMTQLNVSGLSFKGAWDPTTNTPTLIDGTGSVGDFYKASTGGTYNFGNGSYTFNTGDWAIFAAGVWQRIGSSELVASVNGKIGDVVLTAADVGALPSSYTAPVASVNSKTGAVTLTAADVGARASATPIPWADVSGKPVQRGTIGPAIPACLVRRTASQAIATGTDTNISWQSALYSQFSVWNSGSGFVIPSWARYARVNCHVQWGGSSGSNSNPLVASVRVNGADVPGASRSRILGNINVLSQHVDSGIIPVASGDVLTVYANHTTAATRNIEAASWLQIELYE